MGEGIYPRYGCSGGSIFISDMLVGRNAYLQEITVFMFNGESRAGMAALVLIIIHRILVGRQQVYKFPGCVMQGKHTQEYDRQ